MLTRERMRELIDQYDLSRVADQIMDDVKPCIRLKLDYAPDETILGGASKTGGSPDVPAGFEWPTWNDLPLTFIGQIRLSEAKPFDEEDLLPASGLIYFFFGSDSYFSLSYEETQKNSGPYKVFYARDEQTPLRRFNHPVVLAKSYTSIQPYQSAQVSFAPDLSLTFESNLFNPDEFQLGEVLLTPEEKARYLNCWDEAIKASSQPYHQLLGHENDVQFGYQSAKHAQAAWQIGQPEDWTLLLQVDTDDANRQQGKPGFIWGDCGLIYYWINKTDLKAGNVDRIWLDLICT